MTSHGSWLSTHFFYLFTMSCYFWIVTILQCSYFNFLSDCYSEMNTLFGSSKACCSVHFVSFLCIIVQILSLFYCFAGSTMVLWSHLILVLKGTRFVFVHYYNLHWLFTLHGNYCWLKYLFFFFPSWFFHFWSVGCIWWWGCRGTTSQGWKVGLYQWGMHISPRDDDYVCFLVSD